jgi:trans-aconitate methyltransferase
LIALESFFPTGAAVLDLGCGSGAPLGRYFVDCGLSVTGLDSAPEMIALFEKNLPDQDANVGDMRTLAHLTNDESCGGRTVWLAQRRC